MMKRKLTDTERKTNRERSQKETEGNQRQQSSNPNPQKTQRILKSIQRIRRFT